MWKNYSQLQRFEGTKYTWSPWSPELQGMRPTPTGPIGWLHLCYCSYSGVYYRAITTGIIGGATEVVLQSSYVPMGWWSMGVVECGEVPMTLIHKIVHFHFYLSLVFSQSFILIIGTHSHMIPWHAEIPVLIQWYFIEMCKKNPRNKMCTGPNWYIVTVA